MKPPIAIFRDERVLRSVDTRNAGDEVTFGTSTVDGFAAFGANWLNVDYFNSSVTHTNRNSFQLVLIDRSDTGAGNFDIEFNYGLLTWEAGQPAAVMRTE